MEKLGIIYCYKNKVNGKCYIGQTVDEKKRKRDHKSVALRSLPGCTHFHNAIRKYGMDGFEYTVLHSGKTKEELNILEAIEIDNQKTLSPFGYNLKTGGGQRVKLSDESKAKMRASMKKKFSDPEYLRVHIERMNTPEVKARVSESLKKSEKFQKANRDAIKKRKAKNAAVLEKKRRIQEILCYVTKKEKERFHKTDEYKRIAREQRACEGIGKENINGCIPVFCETNGKYYISGTAAAKELGLNQVMVSRVVRGKNTATRGYYFRKATDAEAREIKEQYSK